MTLPIVLSVPHAGLLVPPDLEDLCLLTPDEVAADGDGGAAEIYDFGSEFTQTVTTKVARAVVDMNRAEDDRRKDGVLKTHTCWDVPIWREPLSAEISADIIERYHRPYHGQLTEAASSDAWLGLDAHTMADRGPPVGPDSGVERPPICLSHANVTCPEEWMALLSACLEETFGLAVSINVPFTGGYIIRSHASEMPWVQLELSRAPFVSNAEKRDHVLRALERFCERVGRSK